MHSDHKLSMIGKFSDTNSRRSNTEEEVKSCYDRSNKDKDELDTQTEDTQVEREARSRITKSRTPTPSARAIPLTNDHPIQFRVQQKPPGAWLQSEGPGGVPG